MNNTNETDAAQAANRGNRGRGRGGGRVQTRTTQRSAVPQARGAKIGPVRLMEADWVKDSLLQGSSFVLFAGHGSLGDQQWTFHRAIGETSLGEDEWVATPTRDMGYLLLRKESEELTSWKRRSELAKRQEILRLRNAGRGFGEDGQTEVWLFENAPAVQPTIRTCMAAAKAAGANESAWLDYADRAVQAAERSFKEALRATRELPAAWLRDNPKPAYETRGGPLGDRPQVAIAHLRGLSLTMAKDLVIRMAIGAEPAPIVEAAEGNPP